MLSASTSNRLVSPMDSLDGRRGCYNALRCFRVGPVVEEACKSASGLAGTEFSRLPSMVGFRGNAGPVFR